MKQLFRQSLRNYSSQQIRGGGRKVGFIGLGNMGGPMAVNLKNKGQYDVIGFDLSEKTREIYKKEGIAVTGDLKSIFKQCQDYILMLPNHNNVRDVVEGPNGIFKNTIKGSMILDCSTIAPKAAIGFHEAAKRAGHFFCDSPVSGGVGAAKAAKLTFMVGTDNKMVFERAKELLQHMGANVVNTERPGCGQIAKMCNNMALAIEMLATSEAMALGKKAGLDSKILAKIMNMSSGRCWSSEIYNPCPGVVPGVPSNNNYNGGFASQLMLKDLGIAFEAAKETKASIPLGDHAKKLYEKVCKSGNERKDFSVVYDLLLNNKL